ncbi:hypothetical protein D3C80_665260 [compost metagenome]
MLNVEIGESLNDDMLLWRYMSIDKFIDLLSNKKLFLTPLSYYSASDPFEGFIPKVAFEAILEIFLKSANKMDAMGKQIEHDFLSRIASGEFQPTSHQYKAIDDMKRMSKVHRNSLIPLCNKIFKSTCVHCWYHSKTESEAMWKLYSDSGKGIAIKTSVGSLIKAINSCQQKIPLRLGKVKYLDFLCNKLTPKDCVVDGTISPLLKRNEYAHENEVRLYSVPQLHPKQWVGYEPQPILVDIDIATIIEGVYISPYVGEPFISSVSKLCELFEIPEHKVIKSQLLYNYEEMLSGLIEE